MKLRVILHESGSGYWNMAVDEALLRCYKAEDPPVLRIYTWRPSAVSIGRSQKVEEVVKLDSLRRKGFSLVRRITGGGALLHAENYELTYSVVMPINHPLLPRSLEHSAAFIADSIRIALNKMGILAANNPICLRDLRHGVCYLRAAYSDILVNGRKISGSAQFRTGKSLLQHGTLLLNVNVADWVEVLRLPGGCTADVLKRFITSLSEHLSEIDVSELISALIEAFCEKLNAKPIYSTVKDSEYRLAEELLEKYKSEEWTFMARYGARC